MQSLIEQAAAAIDASMPAVESPRYEWPHPQEIKDDLPPAPTFDAAVLLPETLATFVLDEADRMSAAPDFVAAPLLVALGATIGARCALKPKRRDDWIVTPNLFGGVVGAPSSKKSPAAGTVMRFLDRLEAKEAEVLQERLKLYEAEMAAFEANEAAVKGQMKKAASGKPDAEKMHILTHELAAMERPEPPIARRFKTNDSTVEKLTDLLSTNHYGLLVFRDELMGLLSSWEKEGREGDRAFYLEGWNGTGSYVSDRIGRGTQVIKTHCLSVFGGIQPDLLQKYLSTIVHGFDNDGRIQRFQVLVYPDLPTWKWTDRYPAKGAREAVRDTFDRLADFDPGQDGAQPADDFVKLPAFSFDDAAQEIFVAWSTELNTVRIPQEQNPLMQEALAKYEKLFCSIALILHLASGQIGDVGADSALRAAAWCEYLEAHARRIYGLIETAKTGAARMLGRRIQEGKLANGFTVRDVTRKGWGAFKTTADVEGALDILEDHHWVVSYEDAPETGRPTTRYAINPKVRAKS